MPSLKTVTLVALILGLAPASLSAQSRGGSIFATAQVIDMQYARANHDAAHSVALDLGAGTTTRSARTRRTTGTATVLGEALASAADPRRKSVSISVLYW
jgi:hypothetical protein